MRETTLTTADLPRLPTGYGNTAEDVFRRAAERFAAVTVDEESLEGEDPFVTRSLTTYPVGVLGTLEERLRRAPNQALVVDRYRVLRCIGSGGMGVVYEAVDLEREARVALKTLQRLSPRSLYRFKREFRSVRELVHPNLVALYDLVRTGGEWFFTMELVEGSHFVSYLHREGDFDEGRLREAFLQLAVGVDALHRDGKLHRDLNSANVLVTRSGRVVILDFGLVTGQRRRQEGACPFDAPSGTPGYMAPEQAANIPVAPASDWYAVGVMLYEALTGTLPFTGSARRILSAKQLERPAAPSTLVPKVPRDLDELCMALLERRPEARPGAEQILRALGSVGQRLGARRSASFGTLALRTEAEALASAYREVLEGKSVIVCVHGESGSGKSTLVQSFVAELRRDPRARAYYGRSSAHEKLPFRTLDAILDAIAQEARGLAGEEAEELFSICDDKLFQLFPVLSGISPVSERRSELIDDDELERAAQRPLAELFQRLASQKTLVLALDDVEWGDEASARLLAELCSSSQAPHILLVCSFESEAKSRSAFLSELERRAPRTSRVEIRLGPLAQAGGDALPQGALDAQMDELFSSSSSFSAARRLCEILALAERPLELEIALAAAELGREANTALALLFAGGFVCARRAGYREIVEIACTRIREQVRARLDDETRRRCHGRLARALEGHEDRYAAEIAIHFHGAGEIDAAARHAENAAHEATRALDFDKAVSFYEIALQSNTWSSRQRHAIELRRADALARAGRPADAVRAYLESAANAPRDEALLLQGRAAERLLAVGYVEEGVRLLRPVFTAYGLSYPDSTQRALFQALVERAALMRRLGRIEARPSPRGGPSALVRAELCWGAARGIAPFDQLRSGALMLRALRLALDTGAAAQLVPALGLFGWLTACDGSPQKVVEGARLVAEAERIAARSGDAFLLGVAESNLGAFKLAICRFRDARALLISAHARLAERPRRTSWEFDANCSYVCRTLLMLGEIDELTQHASAWRTHAREHGVLFAEVEAGLWHAHALVVRDELRAARELIRGSRDRWSGRDFDFRWMLGFEVESLCDLAEGEALRAHERIRAAWPKIKAARLLAMQILRIGLLHLGATTALAAAASGERAAELLDYARHTAEELAQEGPIYASASAALIRAGVTRLEGELCASAAWLRATVAAYEAADMPLLAAATRRRQGELLGGEEGRARIEEADREMSTRGVASPARFTRLSTGLLR